MRFLQSLFRRWQSLRAKDTSNLALREELQFHLERETEENIARGMSPEQARHAASASFGSLTQATEESYVARGVAWIDDLTQDLRYGLRSLRRDLAATLTVVLLLSFGLSAATLLFTALDRWVLRPFHVAHPETLVRAAIKRPSIITRTSFSYEHYQSIRHMSSLHDLAAVADFDTTITTGGASELAIANMVSGNYFQVLGVAPQLGRVLGPADEQPVGPAVVISHPMWMNRFGGSPSVIGSVDLFARSALRDCRRHATRFLWDFSRLESRSLVAVLCSAAALKNAARRPAARPLFQTDRPSAGRRVDQSGRSGAGRSVPGARGCGESR